MLAAIRNAHAMVVLTGAGVSKESGIPTFRDAMDGLWAKYDPVELATPEAFARDPEKVTRWYDERRVRCSAARPNPGHRALVQLQDWCGQQGKTFTLVTQNIDRLHQAAGSRDVIELHGSVWVWRCVECGMEREERGPLLDRHPPRCDCGGFRRPAVVWFGEMLPERALQDAFAAAEQCDLFLSIGTSGLVTPAADLLYAAKDNKALILEINPEPTPATALTDWMLQGPAGQILPRLLASLCEDR